MELADVLDSKSSGSDTVPVRPRSPAPTENAPIEGAFFRYINKIVIRRFNNDFNSFNNPDCFSL